MDLKRFHIILIVLIVLFLPGCNKIYLNVEEKISTPTIEKLPIHGTWEVQKFIPIDSTTVPENNENYSGEIAVFDNSIALLGKESITSPEYKIKSVSAEKYFLYKYKVDAVKLGIKEKNVKVVTVSSNAQSFHDFIKIDENSLLVYENHGFLYVSKVSDLVDYGVLPSITDGGASSGGNSAANQDSLLRSGVFIGLRTPGPDKETGSSYRTLWIASKDREIRPIFEVKQLLVPRRKGFWEIGYLPKAETGLPNGALYSHSLVDDNSYNNSDNNNSLKEDGKRDILFVGNDYIGTEYRYSDPVTLKERSRFQVLPIDNIRSGMGISILDIAGEEGLNVLTRSSQAYIMSLDKSKSELLEKQPAADNFSLSRRNGQWIVTGRLNYVAPINNRTSEDFNIYLMPPQKLISYDTLKHPWNYIKEMAPEAIDVYTSPNNDLAIIVTRTSIDIYTIDKERLSEKPVQNIKLKKDESVVMAEWAVGGYMEKWEKVIKSRANNSQVNFRK